MGEEPLMPALSFDSILQQERILLDEAAKKLAVFDKEAEGDEMGEVVYASLVSALDLADKNLQELAQVWSMIQQASASGQVAINALPDHMKDRAQFFQGRDPQSITALNNIIMALRLCSIRPSDVWRAEIRRQADALLGRLHQSLMQGTDPKAIEGMAQVYTSAFCWFEMAWFDADGSGVTGQGQQQSLFSQLFSMQGALLVAGLATAGYFGGRYAVPFVTSKVGGMFGMGGRTKNKQIEEDSDDEDDDEEEDDDAAEDSDDEDGEDEEETTFNVSEMPPLQLGSGA